MSSLTQLCSFISSLLCVHSHNFAIFSSQHSYEFPHAILLFFHPTTFMSSLTQLCAFFIPPLRYLTIFFQIFPFQHFYEFPHKTFSNFFIAALLYVHVWGHASQDEKYYTSSWALQQSFRDAKVTLLCKYVHNL